MIVAINFFENHFKIQQISMELSFSVDANVNFGTVVKCNHNLFFSAID